MAKKKTRRVPQSSTPRMYSTTPPPQAADTTTGKQGSTAPAPAPAPARAARPSAAAARTVSSVVRPNVPLSVEYRYVVGDLRRLGITALTFFIVLIAAGVAAYFLQR